MVEWLKVNVFPKEKDIDAGAVYYQCEPSQQVDCEVQLFDNHFKENIAGNKGGALRWVNKRFNEKLGDSADSDSNSY